jgi:DNA-binding IscR family transcriptional regulator
MTIMQVSARADYALRAAIELAAAPEISLADVIRAVDGQLPGMRGEPPENVTYPGPAEPPSAVVGGCGSPEPPPDRGQNSGRPVGQIT